MVTNALWWLSFADPSRPKGTQFLGVAIVRVDSSGEGDGFFHAVRTAHALGINPGGQVQGHFIPPDIAPLVDAKWVERLLTREECEQFDREWAQAHPPN
jgi:hypothetical protein